MSISTSRPFDTGKRFFQIIPCFSSTMGLFVTSSKKNDMSSCHAKVGVSENRGIPKSSISIGFSIIFTIHFGGFPAIFGSTHVFLQVRASDDGWFSPVGAGRRDGTEGSANDFLDPIHFARWSLGEPSKTSRWEKLPWPIMAQPGTQTSCGLSLELEALYQVPYVQSAYAGSFPSPTCRFVIFDCTWWKEDWCIVVYPDGVLNYWKGSWGTPDSFAVGSCLWMFMKLYGTFC